MTTCFNGKLYEFAVRTWIVQVKQYLTLILVGKDRSLDNPIIISFAATYLLSTAAARWFTGVASNTIPSTKNDFELALIWGFVLYDNGLQSTDKLRRLVQKTSVRAYLAEFRNIVLSILIISGGDLIDRFCQGLKPKVRLEVMRAGVQTMSDASRIALNVDASLFGTFMFQNQRHFGMNTSTKMEIANLEGNKNDRNNNACFQSHKFGCWPWKYGTEIKTMLQ